MLGSGISHRNLPVGAEARGTHGTHFRVWAPHHGQVAVSLEDERGASLAEVALEPEPGGYFSSLVDRATAGMLYRFRLGDGAERFPDPASRFQPFGPHGPSQIVDASAFSWNDASWTGVSIERQVLYEMHVGTFTEEGTWLSRDRTAAGARRSRHHHD